MDVLSSYYTQGGTVSLPNADSWLNWQHVEGFMVLHNILRYFIFIIVWEAKMEENEQKQ